MCWWNGIVLANLLATSSAFKWETTSSSKKIEYHDCYDSFQCARLLVPLDYLNKTDDRSVSIAIIKLPAVVPDNDPMFGGPIFTNPGGPGGSGVTFLQNAGLKLRNLADKPGIRHYEIISFDPRGVGESRPQLDFLPADLVTRNSMLYEMRGSGSPQKEGQSVPYRLAMLDAMNSLREQAYEKKDHRDQIAEYVGTASVARDMIEMLDRIEELRQRQTITTPGHPDSSEDRIELRKRAENTEDINRLQYIGFSYGTVLGNYFASLFPGRVGRMVLDGTSDSVDYATGPGWLSHIADTDKLVDAFFEGCHKAGPSVCALARTNDRSAVELSRRFYSWLHDLESSPQAAKGYTGKVVVLTADDVRLQIGNAMYNPIRRFKTLAVTLDQAMQGNFTKLVQDLSDYDRPEWKDLCPIGNVSASHLSEEDGFPIMCSDGDDVSGYNISWWRDYVRTEISTSKIFGSYWSTLRLFCVAWRRPAKWAFKGPFTSPKARTDGAGNPVPGYPAAPLLVLSNRLDPVSPLRSARLTAAGHPGSRLVIQESIGHCTLSTGQGPCTKDIVAEYFHTGKVPDEKETICPSACGPWDDGCDGMATVDGHDQFQQYQRRLPLEMV